METKFFKCRHCGNIIAYVHSSGVKVVCCGEQMQELVPNTVDASHEKHLPVVVREGNTVTVTIGSAEHPMLPEHHIEWICLETQKGRQRMSLKIGEKPVGVFYISPDDQVVAAFAYCNLHGLWKK
jgi:superoxide reductase